MNDWESAPDAYLSEAIKMGHHTKAAGIEPADPNPNAMLRSPAGRAARSRERVPAGQMARPGRERLFSRLENIDPELFTRLIRQSASQPLPAAPTPQAVAAGLERGSPPALVAGQPAAAGREPSREEAWRAYYERLYQKLGVGLWEDASPYKTGFAAHTYSHILPEDVRHGQTGTFLDPFIQQLMRTGYLPAQPRLWLASYIIHWRRVRWQTGAFWYLMHCLDADPPSHNLSWQWVASTFSSAPYFFTLEDLQEQGVYLEGFDNSPFAGPREALIERLFPFRPAGPGW